MTLSYGNFLKETLQPLLKETFLRKPKRNFMPPHKETFLRKPS